MDWLTVFVSAVLGSVLTLLLNTGVLYIIYSKWILPSLRTIVEDIKANIPSLIIPTVDEKIKGVITYFDEKINGLSDFFSQRVDTVAQSVKQSSARFQRTVNQAVKSVGFDDLEQLGTEEGQEQVREMLANNYGLDVAIQALPKLIDSFKARSQEQANNSKGGNAW